MGIIMWWAAGSSSIQPSSMDSEIRSQVLSCVLDNIQNIYESSLVISVEHRYAESAFMMPDAWFFVKTKEKDGIAKFVGEFILNLPIEVERMLIPMNYMTKENPAGTHWTLLEYDFSEGEWNCYNSVEGCKSNCKKQALIMAKACMPYLIQRYDELNLSPQIVDIKREPLVYKDIFTKIVPEQGHHPDCLIFVCYYMKMSMKSQVRNKWLKLGKEDAVEKANKKRVSLVLKMLTDLRNSWAIDANEDIWDDIARQCDEDERQM